MLSFGQICVSQKVVKGNNHSPHLFAKDTCTRKKQGIACGKKDLGDKGQSMINNMQEQEQSHLSSLTKHSYIRRKVKAETTSKRTELLECQLESRGDTKGQAMAVKHYGYNMQNLHDLISTRVYDTSKDLLG